jgi:hypothetical protein
VSSPKGNRTEEALRKKFQAAEQHAIDAHARWIGHPAVRGVIENHRDSAEEAVAPIGRLLTSQIPVIFFCLHLFGLTGIEPGWEQRKAPIWDLTPSEMNAIEQVKADFRVIIQLTADELEEAGTDVVPSSVSDLVVIGELLLLHVDWTLPARELATNLQPPAIGAILVDASGTIVRRGIWERADSNISALRRSYEQHLHGPPPRAPYAAGGIRALSVVTRQRREALRKVLQRWPGATASSIWTTFGDHGLQRGGLARTPGGYLRQLLQQEAPGEIVHRPAKSTLHNDLKALKAAPPDQKPSG